MTVRELILMLERAVHFESLTYETPVTINGNSPVTGMCYNRDSVQLEDDE